MPTTTRNSTGGAGRLPADARVGIIAGSGRLPVDVAAALARSGRPPFILLVAGEAEEKDFADFEGVSATLEDPAAAIALLKRNGVGHVVLAGGIARRPSLRRIRWRPGMLRMLPVALRALAKGDDALLRAVIHYLETSGLHVVGSQEIVPDLLARDGAMGRHAPARADHADIEAALAGARAIGALDIGQAAIAVAGRVVALEGIEGTAGLLERMKELRGHGRLAGKAGGVLVKCVKPDQDERADLPSIGPSTIEAAHRAGLRGVAVEAGCSFVLDSARTIADADRLGLFVYGFSAGTGTKR